jgi:hypothetical protein
MRAVQRACKVMPKENDKLEETSQRVDLWGGDQWTSNVAACLLLLLVLIGGAGPDIYFYLLILEFRHLLCY